MTAMMEAPTRQKTMPLEEVLKLESGDHGGLMGQFPSGTGRWGRSEWDWTTYDYELVDQITADMVVNGWDGPPVCIRDGVLRNGHHRTIAAYMAGLTEIPWTTHWDESGDF